jgi:DNA-binding SARP family transcriptional activator
VQFSILGPLIVRDGEEEVQIGGGRRRALLLRLLVDRNRVVTSDRLVEDVWDGSPPPAAASTLQSHISQLRRVIGPDRLRTEGGGYRLDTTGDVVDVDLFELEVDEGRRTSSEKSLERALGRWRGAALVDAGGASWAAPVVARLEERKVAAVEALLDLRIGAGAYADVVAEAEVAIAENPLRERLWSHLITALYRSGRQAEALRAYQRLRDQLRDELGIDPSPELRRLEAQVLAQADDLVAPPAAHPGDRADGAAPQPGAHGRPSLPTGAVTFVLTDIVGSTRLWETAPAAMAHALDRHDAILGEAVARHGGVLLKARGEGDSTFSVFQRASDAAAAAVVARSALAAEPWPPEARIVVRMAIHTGEAIERGGDYHGRTVNRVARLRAIAEGDQVLVSEATAQLVLDHLPPGVTLVEAGSRVLRDLDRPEKTYLLTTSPGTTSNRQATVRVPLQPNVASAPVVFVGRDAERDLLASAYGEATGGRCRVVVIAGEPGIGKSALAAAFCRDAHGRGAIVVAGRCDEDVALPYEPWIDILSHVVAHAPAVVRSRADLARVVPGIDAAPPRGDPEADRYLFFAAVAGTLSALAASAPVVLVLDDLQWADKPSLVLLRHVVSQAPPGVLIVLTYRDSDLAADHPLSDTLATLRRTGGFDRITLAGFDDSELVSLMERAAGHRLPDVSVALAHAVRRETAGNPFFAWEVMLHLVESGAVARRDDGTWVVNVDVDDLGLPDSVRDVVLGRVARLGEDSRSALTAAALVGRQFDLDVLARVLERDDDDVLDAVEQAERRGLVTTVAPGRFEFAHGLVQHALLSELSATRRASMHVRVAVAIEELGMADERPADVSRHFAAGGRPADLAKAAEYARRAADTARRNLAPDEAVRWYRESLRLTPETDLTTRCRLLVSLGRAQRDAEMAEFRETLLEAADLARGVGDAESLVRAALSNGLGFGAVDGEVDHDRIAVLEAALEAVGDADSLWRAQLLATLASELTFAVDVSRRRELSDEALAIARRVGDTATLFRVLNLRYTAIWTSDALDERLSNTAEALDLAARIGDPLARYMATVWRYEALVEAGMVDEAEAMVAALTELAERVGLPHLRWTALMHRAAIAFAHSDVDDGVRLADELLRSAPRAVALRTYVELQAVACWHRGRLPDAIGLLRDAAREIPTSMASLGAIPLALAEEDQEAARAVLRMEVPSDERAVAVIGLGAWRLSDIAILTEAAAVLGVDSYAERFYDCLRPYGDRPAGNGVLLLGSVSHWLGVLAAQVGRHDDASVHFAAAEAHETRWRTPFFLAKTRLSWGRSLLERRRDGDVARARELVTQARVAATESGWPGIEREAAELLASPAAQPDPGLGVPCS